MSGQMANGQAAGGMARAQQIHQGIFNDIVESDISEGSKSLLRNLVSKDLVLAYLKEAEINEVKWNLRVRKELYLTMHPDQECLVTGEDRAAINDDATDVLRPLSDEQRLIVDTFFDNLEYRVTRAREMKQQEMLNTQIREQRADMGDDNSKGGLRGMLSK